MTLVKQLTERFKHKPGVAICGVKIEEWVTQNTKYSPSNARRRLRELVEDGVLHQEEKKVNGVNLAFYTYSPEDTTLKEYKYEYEFDSERNCMVEKKVLV